jgi:hypothetical protein
MRNPSSQYVVFIMTSDEPGATRSSASPDGKGGDDEETSSPNSPSFDRIVDSSGFVLVTLIRSASSPSAPRMAHRVVIIDVAIPPKVATFTRDTSVPVTMLVPVPEDKLTSMVCVAGPTTFNGSGIASVMPNIWSEESGKARRNAQKKGEERVTSSGE